MISEAVTPGTIIDAVAEATGVDANMIRGKISRRRIRIAREVASVLLHEIGNQKYTDIANYMGQKSHAPIWNMVNNPARNGETNMVLGVVRRRLQNR